MKKQRFIVGEVVQNRNGWCRLIRRIMRKYLGKSGRFGYFYKDDFGYGMCSEEHLLQWIKKS